MKRKHLGTAAQEKMVERLVSEVREKLRNMGHARRRKRVAETTANAKLLAFERYLRVLIIALNKYFFKTVESLGERHYREYAQHCIDTGLSAGTMANIHSQISDIYLRVLNKDCIGPTKQYYGDLALRSQTCTASKAWEDVELRDATGNLMTPQMVRERVREKSEGAYLVLELCNLLGLRAREAVLFRPHHDLLIGDEEKAGVMFVRDGNAKNGRPRELDLAFLSEADRASLIEIWRRCCSLVTDVDGTVLNPRDLSYSWDRQRRRLNYLLDCAGITKAQLGVTTHGLRHGFLQRTQEHLSGQPIPLHGSLPRNEISVRLMNARNSVTRLLTSEFAGHSRPGITNSYYGSPYKQFLDGGGSRKEWNESLKWVLDIESGDVERLKKRLLQLQNDDVDLDALRKEIAERARLAKPRRPYG